MQAEERLMISYKCKIIYVAPPCQDSIVIALRAPPEVLVLYVTYCLPLLPWLAAHVPSKVKLHKPVQK